MTWSIIGVNKWVSVASDGTSPSGTKAWPAAATTTGDLGLMVLVYRGTASPSVHSDWTLIQSSVSAETAGQEQCTIYTYRHVYAGTAPNMTWVTPTLHSAVITAYRHSSETTYTYGTPATGVISDAGSTSHTLSGGVSSAGSDALVVAFMGNGRGQGYADVNAVTPSTGSGASAVTTAPSSSAWFYRGHEGAISSTAFAAAMADAVLGSGSTGTITAVPGAATRGTVIAVSIKPGTASLPTIGAQPTNQTANEAATATFNVSATGTGTLHYQWKRAAPGSGTFSNVGTDSSSYTTGALAPATDHGATFKVDVTDDNGTTTSNTVTLTVRSTSTTTRPSTDVTVVGWTASGGGSLFDMVDEVSASDADYITSPALGPSTAPVTFGLQYPLNTGTWTIGVRARTTAGTGTLLVELLDSSGTVVGTSATQAIGSTFATYSLSITTSGVAARVRVTTTNP